jgi:hypothetical protein
MQPNLEGVDREERGEGGIEKPATNANTPPLNPPQKADECISNDKGTFSQTRRERFNTRDSMQMKTCWNVWTRRCEATLDIPLPKAKEIDLETQERIGRGKAFIFLRLFLCLPLCSYDRKPGKKTSGKPRGK